MIVIGDVHGCYKTLMALLEKIPEEHKKQICFTGDLIDRGPRSREVVQFVVDNGHLCVMGNHEQMMNDRKYDNSQDALWLGNGGSECLDSYYERDVNPPYLRGDFDKETFLLHKKWMEDLPVVIDLGDIKTPDGRSVVVSHSICHNYWKAFMGENPDRADMAASSIMWGRNFSNVKDQGFFNIIGHTPDEINPKITKVYANIDTGAFCGLGGWNKYKKGGLGKLTALHVETMTIYQQECIDD